MDVLRELKSVNGSVVVTMTAPNRNLFLSSLSPGSRALIDAHCTAVPLPAKTVLAQPGEIPQFAYFLISGLASLVSAMPEGDAVEVGMHGSESVVSALQVLGPSTSPMRCLMQLEGAGLRIPTEELRKIFHASEEVRNHLLALIQVDMLVLGQVAACNRLHPSEERLVRWLLMAQDKVHMDVLDLTQEFLSEMLGARRATLTVVAGMLQRSGLIEYHRGRVKIVDRERLEDVACDCYRVIKNLRVSHPAATRAPFNGGGVAV